MNIVLFLQRHLLTFAIITSTTIPTIAMFDMTQDRPSTTDIPLSISQTYYEPLNRTHVVPYRKRRNRWARCNKLLLKPKVDPDLDQSR